jgi:flagellar basal-body rod modification protein FlgD
MTSNPISNSAPANTVKSSKKELKTEDFIKMMITQLQNQDPLEPAKNQELLAQMSQIGQLQSATSLQETLKSFSAQSQIASAGSMIGKAVEGNDESNDQVAGIVAAVRVEKDKVYLELDSGKTLPLSNVTAVAPATALVPA